MQKEWHDYFSRSYCDSGIQHHLHLDRKRSRRL